LQDTFDLLGGLPETGAILGVSREAAALNRLFPAALVHPAQRIARFGRFLCAFAAREPEGREAKCSYPVKKLVF
jgi:hypothetical protein